PGQMPGSHAYCGRLPRAVRPESAEHRPGEPPGRLRPARPRHRTAYVALLRRLRFRSCRTLGAQMIESDQVLHTSMIECLQISVRMMPTVGATRSHTSKRALAAEVWKLMADFSSANFRRSAQARLMEETGLTPAHFRALSIIDPDEPRP